MMIGAYCPCMKTLGTILPTSKSEAINEDYYRSRIAECDKVAKNSPMLHNCTVKTVGGEKRHYFTQSLYSVVGFQSGRILFFETRKDGDYPINKAKLEQKLGAELNIQEI